MEDHYDYMDRLLRIDEVMVRTGLSRTAVYALMAADLFPRQVLVGRRSVRWRLWQVLAWIQARPPASEDGRDES